MSLREPPGRNTPAYEWWVRGAEDEADARNEGLDKTDREIRDIFEIMRRTSDRRKETAVESLATILYIYTAGMSLKDRLRIAWSVVKR